MLAGLPARPGKSYSALFCRFYKEGGVKLGSSLRLRSGGGGSPLAGRVAFAVGTDAGGQVSTVDA
jgi:hypothetical protein